MTVKQPADYRPPAPVPGRVSGSFARAFFSRRKDLLSLLPIDVYRDYIARVPLVPRKIFIVNHPDLVKQIFATKLAVYPKSDLMVSALRPLVGHGTFITDGDEWRRKRQMMDPSFSHLRLHNIFDHADQALDDLIGRLDRSAASGEAVNVDETLSHLTMDVVYRALFSKPIDSGVSGEIFDAFARYQLLAPQVEALRVLFSNAKRAVEPRAAVLAECRRIRAIVEQLTRERLAEDPEGTKYNDITAELIRARDRETGRRYTLEELIDEIAVLILAGHETSASSLTWALFMLAMTPHNIQRMRDEIDEMCGVGSERVSYEQLNELQFTRAVFREALRLYPPAGFLTRVALAPDQMRKEKIPVGALMVVSPWLVQRHERLWQKPDIFDPDRFMPDQRTQLPKAAYLPFGTGPRVCAGASFATVEGTLILARLLMRYDIEALNPAKVWPVARLTIRPEVPVMCRLRRRGVGQVAEAA